MKKMFTRIELRNTQIWFWLEAGQDLYDAQLMVLALIPGMLERPLEYPLLSSNSPLSVGYGGLSCQLMEGNRISLCADNYESWPLERALKVARAIAAIFSIPLAHTEA